MKKKFSRDMMSWFIALSAAALLLTAGALFVSHGEYFNEIFFHDSLDVGMDFFHSIEYTRGRAPYELFETLYPPLANLFFYVLIRFVPGWQHDAWTDTFEAGIGARGTIIDLRVWQPTMMLFVLFLIVTAVCLVLLIQRQFEKGNHTKVSLFALCCLFSYGVLYGYERGNIIIIALLCTMFFVRYRNSENRFIREAALISLAVAAGLKLYPALFGMLLIYDRQYKRALRTVAYGLAMFIFPVFVFREGLAGLGMFLEILAEHASMEFSTEGFSFDRIVNMAAALFSRLTGGEVNEALLLKLAQPMNLAAGGLVLISGFFQEKRWQRVLACCSAMLLIQFQYAYAVMFLLIPLIEMISEEKTIGKGNGAVFFLLAISLVTLPLLNLGDGMRIVYSLRHQVCILLLGCGTAARMIGRANRKMR